MSHSSILHYRKSNILLKNKSESILKIGGSAFEKLAHETFKKRFNPHLTVLIFWQNAQSKS